jgi:hypothetical protein
MKLLFRTLAYNSLKKTVDGQTLVWKGICVIVSIEN